MNWLQHFQSNEKRYVSGAIFVFVIVNAMVLATSKIMEALRASTSLPYPVQDPFVEELSSGIVIMVLIPCMLWLIEKVPFHWQKLKTYLMTYFLASILFSVTHVFLMVGLRKLIWWIQDRAYNYGDLSFELLYEYRKDLMTFVMIIIAVHLYGFVVSRLQGEASLVSEGENKEDKVIADRLLVKKLGKEFIIKVADIEWLESSGNYVNLHINGRIYPIRSTLSSLINKISDKGFCRIHRSYGINLDVVDSITPLSSGDADIVLKNGKELNLSRRYKDALKARLHP